MAHEAGPRFGVLLRTVVVTAVVTTLFWFGVAVWWVGREPGPAPAPTPASQPEGARMFAAPADVPGSRPTGDSGLVIPVAGVRFEHLADTFAEARASGARRHDAIDILAPRGSAVIAAAPGRVEKLFVSQAGGNTVYVRSPDGRRIYYYAHLDSYARGLAEGIDLPQGAPIGTVGSTGNADPAAPHLHFAVWMTAPDRKWWEDAVAINPYPLLRPGRR